MGRSKPLKFPSADQESDVRHNQQKEYSDKRRGRAVFGNGLVDGAKAPTQNNSSKGPDGRAPDDFKLRPANQGLQIDDDHTQNKSNGCPGIRL